MKKIIGCLLFLLSTYTYSQDNKGMGNFTEYMRFDMGYEHNEFMAHNGWRTRAFAIELEKSFKNTPFSRNYRVSLGLNDSNQFYMHMPAGPIAGLLLFIYASQNANYCTGVTASTLLFILPDGFGFSPVQTEKMHIGMYANFLGIDYCNSQRRNKKGNLMQWDYAPDIGVRFNYYASKDIYFFTRMSAKYSTQFAGWGAQGTAGIGFQFDK